MPRKKKEDDNEYGRFEIPLGLRREIAPEATKKLEEYIAKSNKYAHIYDTAQICLNGHIVTEHAEMRPVERTKFCAKCGARTIMVCPNCHTEIRGFKAAVRPVYPRFCHKCGKPYPWTESKIKGAQDLIKELNTLSEEDRNFLKQSIPEIINDTPQAKITAIKFKKTIAKAGKGARIVGKTIKEILGDLFANQDIIKLIWPR